MMIEITLIVQDFEQVLDCNTKAQFTCRHWFFGLPIKEYHLINIIKTIRNFDMVDPLVSYYDSVL